MRALHLLFTFLICSAIIADEATPYSAAMLVHEADEAVLFERLRGVVASPEPLARATAARVIAVRGLEQALPLVSAALSEETDPTAAREQVRTLALIGGEKDLATAVRESAKWPAGVDNALALAVARRGGIGAIQTYASTLKKTRMRNTAEFFRVALWGHTDNIPYAGSLMLGARDDIGWTGLLDALRHSRIAMDGAVMASSLDLPSEPIRSTSVWYLVNGYAIEPLRIADVVKEKLTTVRSDESSDREDFGRELLRRMLGGERKDDARWKRFLDSEEADRLLPSDSPALQYLTDSEYDLRHARCASESRECVMPPRSDRRPYPSQPVAPPAFDLPAVLPAGLADAILDGTGCKASWIGVANASVDHAGRIRTLDLSSVSTRGSCKRAVETLLKLSMATNTSMRSGFTGPVLLVRPERGSLCLDEDPPEVTITSSFRAGGEVQQPKIVKRVEPLFPASTRKMMTAERPAKVVVESVISRTGCVRSLRVIEQSPFPELNGSALMALAQWQFMPGYLGNDPVDVIFSLTMTFKTNRF